MTLLLDVAYLLALTAALPFLAVRAAFSARWRAGWGQRLGFIPHSHGPGPCVWIHAASVGEVNAARTLIEAILAQRPDWRVALSVNTNTGFQVAQRFADRVVCFYFPLDVSWAIRRVLRRIRPSALVLVEGEFWPNLLRVLRRRRIPVVLVNGRMREEVAAKHRAFGFLFAPLHDPHAPNVYCVQNETYAERFRRAGFPAEKIRVTGTMKYDVVAGQVPGEKLAALRQVLGLAPGEALWIAACTWPGEEAICLRVHRRLLEQWPDLRILIAPRHIERAGEVADEVRAAGMACFRRSEAPVRPPRGAALVLDTIGELAAAYGLARFAFVGKSLTSSGGHNMLEPAALGVPALFGPHTGNFAEESQVLLEAQAAVLVQDEERMYNETFRMMQDAQLRERMGEAGRRAVLARRGATARHLGVLAAAVGPPPEQ